MEGSCYNQIALPYTHALLVAKSSWQLADYRLMLEVHDFEPSRMKELKPHQGKVPAPENNSLKVAEGCGWEDFRPGYSSLDFHIYQVCLWFSLN